jgi:hypothetical protein
MRLLGAGGRARPAARGPGPLGDRLRLLATFEGFLRAAAEAAAATSTTASRATAGLDQRADLLARTVQRAFESGRTIPRSAQQSIATAVIDLLADLTIADRADLGIAEA